MLDEFSRKKKASADSQPSSQNAKSPSHSSDSASVPPRFEAPKLGVSRIAQLEKAKREGADYRKQREKEEKKERKREGEQEKRKTSQSGAVENGDVEKQSEAKSRGQSQASDSIPPEMQFSQTFIDSFFEEREPIPPLTEEEEREVYRIVNEYFLEHPPEGADYLVTGAAFICKYCQETNGSCEPVRILRADHGVYADHGRFALLGSRDQIDDNHPCGKCKYLQSRINNPSKIGNSCVNAPHWENTPSVFFRDGNRALTMDSYTVCNCNPEAIIRPISSGQEYMRKVLHDDHSGNPIIIVPGIMGSRLYKDTSRNARGERQRYNANTRVWEPDSSSIFEVDDYLAPDSNLSVRVRPCENQNYARPCYAQGSVKLDGREYGTQNLAKALVDGLCECEKLDHRRVYMFSYDWRQSNFISATKLRRFIEKLCKEEGFEKVDLIGHSMGGLLISSLYAGYIVVDGIADPLFTIRDLSIRSKIDKIITLGTPYEGAPKLIDAVVNEHVLSSDAEIDIKGRVSDILLASPGKLSKKIKSSFRGVAELIPTKSYVDTGRIHVNLLFGDSLGEQGINYSSDYKDYLDCCKKIFSEDIIEKAVRFQNAIREEGKNILLGYPKAFFIVGTGYPTLYSIFLNESGDELNCYYDKAISTFSKRTGEKYGDGTVPYFSSTMGDTLPQLAKERFCSYQGRHVELCSLSNSLYAEKGRVSVLDNIIYILLHGSMLVHE